MTFHRKIALRAAWLFFGIWLLIALGAADFPPPPGFVFVVLILLACALLLYLRLPVYLRWRAEGAKGRILRVARDGFIGGGTSPCCPCSAAGSPPSSRIL